MVASCGGGGGEENVRAGGLVSSVKSTGGLCGFLCFFVREGARSGSDVLTCSGFVRCCKRLFATAASL